VPFEYINIFNKDVKSRIMRGCLVPLIVLILMPCAAVAGTATVSVGWDASTSPVAGYEVSYGTTSGEYDYVVDVGNHTSVTISGLEEGTTYYFAVKAYNSEGVKSTFSEELVYTVQLTNAPLNEAGPRIIKGLQALYTFDEGSGTTVYDTSDVGEPLDLTVSNGTVNWVSGGLAITSAALIKSAGPATKLIEACRATNAISIEAWLKPANTTQEGPARIVTLSQDPYERNFTLGQHGGTLNQRLRTTATNDNGSIPSLATSQGLLSTELTHVLYTFDSAGVARIYVNGVEVSSRTIGGNLSNWNGNYYFGLANEITNDRPWLGELYLVAVYDRALDHQEISQNFQAGINPSNKQPPPPADTDSDGILDEDEINIYGTDPDQSDTDNDGMLDGDELQYWGNKWNLDIDSDGVVNLLDTDSDGDGLADGNEVTNGNDPANPLNITSASGRINQGLQALYTFDEGSGTTVYDTSGVGTSLDLSVDSGTVNWVSGGLAITSAALIKSAGPATKIIEACKITNEISIEAWVKPANTTQRGPVRIVTLSQNPSNRNFTLGQSGDLYDVRLRTTATSANGIPSLATPQGSLSTELTHVLYTFDSVGVAKIYVNGTEVSSQTVGSNLSNWSGNYEFGFANEMTNDRPWLGELYLVAVYDRALEPQEVDQNFQAGINPGNNQSLPPVDSNNDSYSGEPETATQDPPAVQDVKTWIEAEDGILNYPIEYAWDNSASAEGFIWVPNGQGSSWDPNKESGYAEYSFEVPAAGDYVIWGRIKAQNGGDDSFFISVDDGSYALWDTGQSDSWLWDQVSNRGGSDPVVYHLEAGEHVLTIKQREDGTKIDKIVITNDPAYVPQGLGENQAETGNEPDEPAENIDPAEFKLWLEAEKGSLSYPFESAKDNNASAGQFAWVPNGQGSSSDPSQESGYAEYSFEVPAAGDYVIWGRVLSKNSGDNSFFVSVDGGAYSLWDTKKSNSWVWDPVNDRGGADPVVYQLDAGEHTLIIKQREDGTKIDRILVTGDMEFVPE
jgi:hypothetical protein